MSSIIRADTIQDLSGNNIINESGNTITIGASGDTTNIVGTLQNNGSAVGGANSPAWMVHLSSSQNVSSGTETVINFDTEVLDSDSAYNTSNGRFTVPSGQAGKYYVYAQLMRNNFFNSRYLVKIRVNDTQKIAAEDRNSDTGGTTFQTVQVAGILDLSVGDYVNVALYQNSGSSAGANGGTSSQSLFMGYKLIGV